MANSDSKPDTDPNWVGSFGSARYTWRYVATLKFSHICITIMVNINTDSQLPCWWWTQMTADFEELTNANFFYLIQSFLAARSETRANYRQSKGDTQALFLQVFTSIYCCQLVHNITHNFGQLEVLNMTNAINNGHLLVKYTVEIWPELQSFVPKVAVIAVLNNL